MFSKRCMKACGMVMAATMAFVLTGCGGSDGSGDGSGDGTDTGTLSLSVTDAPVDEAQHVFIYFTGVEIQSQSGEPIMFDLVDQSLEAGAEAKPRTIDLLELQGIESEPLLVEQKIASDAYNQIRLTLADPPGEIVLPDGTSQPLFIPSGNQTGLKINHSFTVEAGSIAHFTIDFDLRKSVHYPMGLGGLYILRPTLRLVDNFKIGSIAGTVDANLLGELCLSPAVYVFAEFNVIPDDIDDVEPDPITSAMVNTDTDPATYVVGFLPPGEYTAALTCDAADDNPELDDSGAVSISTADASGVVFISTANVTVEADIETTLNFEDSTPTAPLPPPLPLPSP